jgi:hypothetical protein
LANLLTKGRQGRDDKGVQNCRNFRIKIYLKAKSEKDMEKIPFLRLEQVE